MRVVIPKSEADALVRSVCREAYEGNLRFHKALGLFRWSPEPCDTAVEDTDRAYYFWLYLYEEDIGVKSLQPCWVYVTVGTSPRGGDTLFEEPYESDVIIDAFFERENVMENMARCKVKDLKQEGLNPLEIINILGS